MIEVTRHTVEISRLHHTLEGLKIVQLTDLHRSSLTSDRLLRRAITLANSCVPDLIVLTGDYISNQVSDIAPVAHLLSVLHAPLGVLAIMGNHDHHTDAPGVVRALQHIGVHVLQNQNLLIKNQLRIVGLEDDRKHYTNVPRAFEGTHTEETTVVLAHNPALVELLADRTCIVLSGHTHGGQIHLPILTRREIRRIGAKHYRAGWYTVGKARLYVCRGIGNVGVPIRLFARPEVAQFTLTRAQTIEIELGKG
jgi:predicted MPP superfamily phosphohydrolase